MKLSRINTALLWIIIVINGYTILAPFWPALVFRWDNRGGVRQQQLSREIHPSKTAMAESSPKPNQLIIPSMLLDRPILDGPVKDTYKILANGIWRWPLGSTPDKGSNTILIGHRFTYTQPKGVFYYLNKVKAGDEIGLWWNNHLYIYKVTSINEVPPTDTAIENATTDKRLTIFTCTPLWLPKDRLVVVAELEDT